MEKEYLVVIPIEPIEEGFVCGREESLPLHCTVIPWFRLRKEENLSLLTKYLADVTMPVEIELVSKKRAYFDPDETVPVHVLEENNELHFLHAKLLLFLLEIGASLEGKLDIIANRYRPHVSDHDGKMFPPKKRCKVTEVILVEKDETHKTVIGKYFIDNPF